MAIQFMRGARSQWLASTLVLQAGQPGVALDTGEVRVGNGTDLWKNLPRRGHTYNVKDYGAKGDGVTDDTAAINAALADMPAIPGSFNGSAGTLVFPAGRYMTDGGHVVPSSKRLRIIGDGPYNTILYRRGGATGDLLTFNGQASGVEGLTISGDHVTSAGSGDGLVFNAGYGYAINCWVNGNGGNGISIGKAAGAILVRLEGLNLRLNRGHGIQVFPGTSSDGEWVNIDIGTSGLNGVKIEAAAQQLTNVHVWGSGIEAASTSDKAGFRLATVANMLTGCESESNAGAGILITGAADGQGITGCDIWGNCQQGIYSFGGNRFHTISGNRIRNNGILNTSGANTSGFASILNEGGTQWAVTGNTMFDSGVAIAAGSYPNGYVPANPFPGRDAIRTVSRHYHENSNGGAPDFHAFTGNVWRTSTTAGSGTANLYVGTGHQFAGNVT